MAAKGSKDNPFLNLTELKKSDVYYSGNKAVKKMEEILDRKLTPTEKKIVAKEGYVDGYYLDSRDILTRGVGQTGDYAKGKESHSGFEKAIADSTKAANKQAEQMRAEGRAVDPNFTESLVGVNFQLGSEWTTKFPTAWSNLQSGDYEDAIEEIRFTKKGSGIASDWAKQTPTRVDDFTQAIRNQADYKPGKRSFLDFEPNNYFGEATRVASLDDDMVFGGSANLYANQNLPKAPRNLGTVELPPDQTITPYRETIKEDVTVRPDQIRTTETIGVTAPRYSVDEQQERARRSMMQGNYDDRMEDYKYSSEYQEDYPYLYPNKRGSMQPNQIEHRGMEAAQSMMGRGMGYAEGGSVNQAEGIASLGRGGDSTLVHMQPQEVAGLQQMAQANGTSLTTNPMTGMPEAFSLGGMFRAAAPIAAGYFMGPAGMQMGMGAAIGAGAATGAGIAALSGEDALAGGLSGGLGGYSGFGMSGAFTGVGDAVTGEAMANSTLPQATKGASMMTDPSLVASTPSAGLDFGAGLDKLGDNINVMTQTPELAGTGKYLGGEQIMESTGKMQPGSFFDKAKVLGAPAVSMGMGGLEVSDFYDDDIDFSQTDKRDKYNPYSKLNLNTDTGINESLAADTGLRLFAEGGSIGNVLGLKLNTGGQGNQTQRMNVNTGGQGNQAQRLNLGRGAGSLNLNTGAMSQSANARAEAARLKAIEDAKPVYQQPFIGMQQGPTPGDIIFSGQPGLASTAGRYAPTPGDIIFSGQQGFAEGGRVADPGALNLNTGGQGNQPRGMNLTSGLGSLNLNTGAMSQSANARAAAAAEAKRKAAAAPSMEFVRGQGMRPVGAIMQGPAQNYDRLIDGSYRKRYAEGGRVADPGALNLNTRGLGNQAQSMNLGRGAGSLNLNTGAMGQSANAIAAEAAKPKTRTMRGAYGMQMTVPIDYDPGTKSVFGGRKPSHYQLKDGTYVKGTPQPINMGFGNPLRTNNYGYVNKFAEGGYLQGPGDGMSDDIPATINGEQPAALADGEFVVPADVVSHLGNGSSEAGSKQLYAMMDRIRKARTGRESQGKEINPKKYMPT